MRKPGGYVAFLWSIACFYVIAFCSAPALGNDGPIVAKPTISAPVSLTDNGTTWTLDNGVVKLTVIKQNGRIGGLVYHGVTVTSRGNNWAQMPSGTITSSVTIDPANNKGERAEVAVKGVNGRMDIELRYALERGTSGFYTYAQYVHEASYPEAGFGENRFILQMNPTFNWLSVDKDRNMLMMEGNEGRDSVVIHAKEQSIIGYGKYKNSVEHKYSYCGVMYKLPAYGWSSTKDHIGVYFINPSCEYIGGGSEKLDLVCHLGATLLCYWTSGHYAGGTNCVVPAGEQWTKVVGPIFVYFNALENPSEPTQEELDTLKATEGNPTIPQTYRKNALALWNDALEKARDVKAAWPYEWVNGVDYPHKSERANVTGQLVLDDPQATAKTFPHLTVGLTHPDYRGNGNPFQLRAGNGTTVKWPHDANYYQFWNDGNADGHFTITNVRPGNYVLHAFADGILGEFSKADITVEAGKPLDLGKLTWTPVRNGKQIWEIGHADRSSAEFFKGDGDNYWLWGWPLRYGELFPNDITFTIGKSDTHKDWFFELVPHSTTDAWKNPQAKDPLNQRFGWVRYPTSPADPWREWGRGRATTWTIKFNLDKSPRGEAYLRIALTGADGGGGLAIGVNQKDVGTIHPVGTNALRYNTATGVWHEYTQPFDATLLKAGENQITFTVPEGDVTTGVVWDYLRLELNESAKPMPPQSAEQPATRSTN